MKYKLGVDADDEGVQTELEVIWSVKAELSVYVGVYDDAEGCHTGWYSRELDAQYC